FVQGEVAPDIAQHVCSAKRARVFLPVPLRSSRSVRTVGEPVSPRRTAPMTTEQGMELADRTEARCQRDVDDLVVRADQKGTGMGQSKLGDVVGQRLSGFAFEEGREII